MGIDWSERPARSLVAGGYSLEYAALGPEPGSAPTLVLLHEGLGCVALWRDFPARLARATGLGVFAYSRAGYGQSDAPGLPRPLDFMHREADVLGDVLDAIGASEVILLGHSDGASIAAIHTGTRTARRVRGMILMAPHFFTEPDGLAAIGAAREDFERGGLREKLARYHRDPEAAFRGWNDVWLDPAFRDWDITDVIDYFRVPVLAIQGENDQYGTRAQIDVIADRAYSPVDTLLLPDCAHAPHLEQPDATLSAVAEFAGRLQRIEAAKVETA